MAEKSAAHEVHLDRLFSARRPRWLVRVAATVVCHAIVAMFRAVAGLLEPVRAARRVVDTGGSRCRGGRACRPARIVLTGTFAADNWLRAHVLPVAATEQCARVFVVSDRPFLPMRKVTYVCPPRWLVRVVGRTPARSVWFVLTCLLRKPDVVGGFHLLFNGLVALVTAPVVGARAAYFCVGGWAEVIQGGVHGGNKLFNRIGRDDPVLEGALLALVKRFDLILTMGTGARDFFRARGVSCRIEVMSGGIDDRLYAPDGSGTRYDIVTVSRIVPVKRMDVFLDVVRKVAEACPEVRVAVVGDGEALAAARRHAEAIGVADRVVFAGRQGDVGPWLARSRVFLLTSDSEGLSLALMEAGMAGLPAVVSDVGDLGDLVADGVNGWLIPPGAVDRFAERVTALLCDDALYARCASAARERALAHSVSSATRRWMDVLSAMGVARGMVDRDGAAVPETAWRVPSRRALWRASKRIMGSRYVAPVSLLPPQVWLGREFRRALRRVESAQFWSRDEATAYQLRALQRIVSLAYDGSVYYRESLGGVGFEPGDLRTPADLSSLPMIDADVVRAHGRDMCTVASVDEVADYVSTGGTGGKPLH
ncbi:MAG: glycosyltransferase, partial [Phycisphaerae bacterium]